MAQDNLLENRFVTVYLSLDGERGRGLVMQDCTLQEIGGKLMLVGTCTRTARGGEDEWSVGVRAAVPWDAVVTLFSMTAEQFRRNVK